MLAGIFSKVLWNIIRLLRFLCLQLGRRAVPGPHRLFGGPAPRSARGSAKTEILFESTRHPQLTRGQRGPGGTSPAAAKAQP